MWIWMMANLALAQSENIPAWSPSISDAQALAAACEGPTSCDFSCWDDAVRLLEPTERGGVRMACYAKGESHGPIVSWYANGRKEGAGFSTMGIPVGGYVAWHDNGKAAATGRWFGGDFDGPLSTWHPNGAKQSQGVWDRGVQTGMVRHWHDNGQLEEVGTWHNQQPDGPVFSWYADGTRKARAYYKAGTAHGTWKEWYSSGKRYIMARYVGGTAHIIRCWQESGKQMPCPTADTPQAPSNP